VAVTAPVVGTVAPEVERGLHCAYRAPREIKALQRRLPKFAAMCALFAFGAGVALLLAWKWGWSWLIQVVPHQPVEVPLTALSLCLSALTLTACAFGFTSRPPLLAGGRMLAGLLVLLGGVVLLEYLAGLDSGIENLLYASKLTEPGINGRPSPQTAISMVLFGAAAWLYFGRRSDRFDLADVAAAASFFLPAAALLSYLFDIDRLGESGEALRFGMPPLAALSMTVLAVGLQSLHPRRGLASLLAAQPDGGFTSRRLLLAAVLMPALLGYMVAHAIRNGVIDLSLGLAITIAASVLMFVVLLIWNAELMMRLYVEQRQQLALREEQARREAATDSLTQLYNRRGWEQCLQIEEQRSERENLDAGVFVIDLDGLKALNDREGHAAGDAMLRRAAQALRGCVRRRDVVARLGGDEYAFLACEIVPGVVPAVEERLRKALQGVGVSASIGFALRSSHGTLPDAAEAADRLMYQDKRARKQGREGDVPAPGLGPVL
jgi:diguanylate cyclase (GGDEF)-like protein